jgi:hypothetical protein
MKIPVLSWFGAPNMKLWKTTQRRPALSVQYQENIVVPFPDRRRIEAEFKARGIDEYTDADVAEAYLSLRQ